MRNINSQISFSLIFGLITMIAGLFAHLALTDIYKAETDLTMEWAVVRVSAIVIFGFIIWSIFFLSNLRRRLWVNPKQ